jgi:hypothetical protein
MKPATLTQAAPSAKPGKLVEFTQSERGQGTQHLDPLPVKSSGFFAQLRPPVSVVESSQCLLFRLQVDSRKLTALSIRMQTLADEGVRATPCIESNVSK